MKEYTQLNILDMFCEKKKSMNSLIFHEYFGILSSTKEFSTEVNLQIMKCE